MEIDNIKLLLIEIRHISNHYDKMATISGENFNIFRTLNLESSEVRLHSNIIAEFLNPNGTHGQHDLFLRLFLTHFGIEDFDSMSAVTEVEKNTGPINEEYTKGGRIDILITDKKNKHIIIENKIYAYDQKNQLLRYYNFDPGAHLFYLNPEGLNPTDFSTNKEVSTGKLKVISYGVDIIGWLEKCKKEAVALPVIRETIRQYINLLKYLTNQLTISKMKDEIKSIFETNPEYIDSVTTCWEVIQSFISETKEKFILIFNERFPSTIFYTVDGISLKANWGEDNDGVYFAYQVFREDEIVKNNNVSYQLINLLKDIDNCMHSNSQYIGWFHPLPFKPHIRFENLDKKLILRMNTDNEYLKNFVDELVIQESKIRNELLLRLEKTKLQYIQTL